jgi:hypothetical protein
MISVGSMWRPADIADDLLGIINGRGNAFLSSERSEVDNSIVAKNK